MLKRARPYVAVGTNFSPLGPRALTKQPSNEQTQKASIVRKARSPDQFRRDNAAPLRRFPDEIYV
jgi:hypothetical protein